MRVVGVATPFSQPAANALEPGIVLCRVIRHHFTLSPDRIIHRHARRIPADRFALGVHINRY
jgi:hypothetical protein